VALAKFEVLSCHLPRRTEENFNVPQIVWLICELRFELGTSQRKCKKLLTQPN
jgi:hypothetical protein